MQSTARPFVFIHQSQVDVMDTFFRNIFTFHSIASRLQACIVHAQSLSQVQAAIYEMMVEAMSVYCDQQATDDPRSVDAESWDAVREEFAREFDVTAQNYLARCLLQRAFDIWEAQFPKAIADTPRLLGGDEHLIAIAMMSSPRNRRGFPERQCWQRYTIRNQYLLRHEP